MRTEKKLFAYCAVAVMIGVASIAPLLFLMSGTAKAETAVDTPWFNIDVPYAYWVTSNGTLNSTRFNFNGSLTTGSMTANMTVQYPNGTSGNRPVNMTLFSGNDTMPTDLIVLDTEINPSDLVSEQHAIVLNFTLNPQAENEISDARFEYFELQMYSDKGPILNMSYFVGTNRTNLFDWQSQSFHFMRGWFDTNTTSGGMFTQQWNTNGTAEITTILGSGSGTIGSSGTSRRVDALRQAETIYIDIRRAGSVTFNGNSTVVTLGDNTILKHIQLNRYGEEGFLHNNLFPENKLSEIDLAFPLQQQPKP